MTQMAMLGMALQFQEPGNLVIAAAFAFQFPRMRYKEKILKATFPGYDAYARATPGLIPRISLGKARPVSPAGT
jgi:protein-S-isoprenylcysteine O-methyltransferase Ste14